MSDIDSAAITDALKILWCQLSEFLAFPTAHLRFSFWGSVKSLFPRFYSTALRKKEKMGPVALEAKAEAMGRVSGKQVSILYEEELSHSQSSEGSI